MNKNLFLMGLILLGSILFSQVGVGTNVPDSSSVLDISSSDKGVLFPRVNLISSTDIVTIPNPANGLVIYNTNTQNDIEEDNFYYWNGSVWSLFNKIPSSAKAIELVSFYRKTSDQNLTAGVISPITFDEVVFNSSDHVSFSGSDTFTALKDGFYIMDFQVGVLNPRANTDMLVGVCNISNKWIGRGTFSVSNDKRTYRSYTTALDLNSGDTFKACFHNAAPVTIQGDQTGTTGTGNITNIEISYFKQ